MASLALHPGLNNGIAVLAIERQLLLATETPSSVTVPSRVRRCQLPPAQSVRVQDRLDPDDAAEIRAPRPVPDFG